MGHEAGPALVADRRILRLITEGVERNSLRRHFRTVRAPGPNVQIGVDSFGAVISEPATGLTVSALQRMDNLLDEIVLADQVGLDVFGIGEHHRSEFVDSAPPVILGAAATRTKNIRLTSAVTVLSAADPVRIFQEFATLDLISHGRAEIVAG